MLTKKLCTLVAFAAITISPCAFAGSDGNEILTGGIEILKNITSQSNRNVQGSGSGTGGRMDAENISSCDASTDSSCLSGASGALNQNHSNATNNVQIAVGYAGSAGLRNTQSGSASNGSSAQSQASYAGNQNFQPK